MWIVYVRYTYTLVTCSAVKCYIPCSITIAHSKIFVPSCYLSSLSVIICKCFRILYTTYIYSLRLSVPVFICQLPFLCSFIVTYSQSRISIVYLRVSCYILRLLIITYKCVYFSYIRYLYLLFTSSYLYIKSFLSISSKLHTQVFYIVCFKCLISYIYRHFSVAVSEGYSTFLSVAVLYSRRSCSYGFIIFKYSRCSAVLNDIACFHSNIISSTVRR